VLAGARLSEDSADLFIRAVFRIMCILLESVVWMT